MMKEPPQQSAVELVGSECPKCGKRAFPTRAFCERCGNDAGMRETPLSRRGVLYSFTVVHIAPPVFPVPYAIGFVDLPGDVRVLAQIDADPRLRIGDEMELAATVGGEAADGIGSAIRFRRVAT